MRKTKIRFFVGCLCLTALFWANSSFGLDQGRINSIRRANTGERLADLAESFLRDDATRKPKDFEEGTQIAAEATVYLLFIQVRQNSLILKKLEEGASEGN